MNLAHIPFHDFRKACREGFRSRDSHLMEHFLKKSDLNVYNYTLVNRPLLLHNIIRSPIDYIRYNKWRELYLNKYKNFSLLDSTNWSLFNPIFQKRKFIWDMYEQIELPVSSEDVIFSQNLYAAPLLKRCASNKKINVVFDAFDNWEKLPFMQDQLNLVESGYKIMSEITQNWTTNSDENAEYFKNKYGIDSIKVIHNGVDVDNFSEKSSPPTDIKNLNNPIFGFAGKITHLVDVNMIEHLANTLNRGSIVIIGQVVDKRVLNKLVRLPKVNYLGDKSYNEYKRFVKNFDVCLIPYHIKSKAHGGDSIKFYEYLATGKPIVATPGNGVTDKYGNVFICKKADEFAKCAIQAAKLETSPVTIPEELSWSYKVKQFEIMMGL